MTPKYDRSGLFLLAGAASLMLGLGEVACKPRQEGQGTSSAVLGSVPLSRSQPPKTVYHFGEYKYLAPLKSSTSYPANLWSQIPSVRYTSYRAGLYTSQHPAYNERYVAENLDDPRATSAWMMVLTLSDECIEAAAPPVNEILASSDFDTYVRGTNYRNAATYNQYCPYNTVFSADPSNNTRNDGCTQLMGGYFQQQGYRVASDHFWPNYGYWIVRDRTCIASIESTPEGVLHALSEVPELWNLAPFDTYMRRDQDYQEAWAGYPLIMILVRALDEAREWDDGDLQAIRSRAATSDMYQIRSYVLAVVDAARRCRAVGNLPGFKAQSKFFIDKAGDTKYLASIGFQKHVANFVQYGLPKACP